MYYQYFGLNEPPFSIAVNPRYLFMSPRHRDALAHLLYGVGAGGGFILLTGEVGTGKTTINRCLLEQIPQDTDTAIILNPALNAMELLASVCDELNIEYDQNNHTLKTLTDHLHKFLLDNHARNRKTVLLIDEAQHLEFDVLEQIRLLTNLETNSEKLLQIILIGQPELAQILARPELRQLNQRITARYNLEPLNLEETGAYINHRLQVAGMSPERVIFNSSVVRGIYKVTRGIPRVINVLCDRMLLGAYGRNKPRADHAMLQLAAREVLGEAYTFNPTWRWVGAIVLLGLLIWAGGWFIGNYTASPPTQLPAASVQTTRPDVTAVTAGAEPSAVDSESTALAEIVSAEPAQVSLVEPVDMAEIMWPPGDVFDKLWSIYSAEPALQPPCTEQVHAGLACYEGEAWTWNDIQSLDRPLLLDVITQDRFSAGVMILGITDTTAWALSRNGVIEVQLADLATYWTGRYRFLWRVPKGFQSSLSLGQEGDVVTRVAALFARLDGQLEPLAVERFNFALQQRVRLFQREQELADDGVVGLQTLLRLNAELGVDVSAAEAREWLQVNPIEDVDR
ncbi:AAA family ATPase [Halioglobus sp.]|nr:AAA family ATPase [Halioglobus sp.]